MKILESKKATLTEGLVKKGGLNISTSTPRPKRPGAIVPAKPLKPKKCNCVPCETCLHMS